MAFGFNAGSTAQRPFAEIAKSFTATCRSSFFLTPRARATSTARAVGLRNTATSKALRTKRCRALSLRARHSALMYICSPAASRSYAKTTSSELAANNQDCVFLIYTNATLVDQKFCDDLKRVGNVALAMSIEGTEESNDWRRGEGAYNATLKAMELLKKNKCLFGISVC